MTLRFGWMARCGDAECEGLAARDAGAGVSLRNVNKTLVFMFAKEERRDDEQRLARGYGSDEEAEYVPHGAGRPVVEEKHGGEHEGNEMRDDLRFRRAISAERKIK